jgi:hypothetical protein
MVPGLGGDDLALKGDQHLLRLSQAQAQSGDVAKIIRLRDLHHVRAPTVTSSARFHQPQNPSHPRRVIRYKIHAVENWMNFSAA